MENSTHLKGGMLLLWLFILCTKFILGGEVALCSFWGLMAVPSGEIQCLRLRGFISAFEGKKEPCNGELCDKKKRAVVLWVVAMGEGSRSQDPSYFWSTCKGRI